MSHFNQADAAREAFTAWIATRGSEQIFLDEAFAAGVAHGRAEALAEVKTSIGSSMREATREAVAHGRAEALAEVEAARLPIGAAMLEALRTKEGPD